MTKDDEKQDRRRRRRLTRKREYTVATNPRYAGLTILEATHRFLGDSKKPKPAIEAGVTFS